MPSEPAKIRLNVRSLLMHFFPLRSKTLSYIPNSIDATDKQLFVLTSSVSFLAEEHQSFSIGPNRRRAVVYKQDKTKQNPQPKRTREMLFFLRYFLDATQQGTPPLTTYI